jgi:hypothetical protein
MPPHGKILKKGPAAQAPKIFWERVTKICPTLLQITKWKYDQKYQILVESLAELGFGES